MYIFIWKAGSKQICNTCVIVAVQREDKVQQDGNSSLLCGNFEHIVRVSIFPSSFPQKNIFIQTMKSQISASATFAENRVR